MNSWKHCCLLTGLIWTVCQFESSYSEVYASTKKIEDMVIHEEDILNNLQAEITQSKNYTALEIFLEFRQQRIEAIHERDKFEGIKEYLNHPNALFHSVVGFATEYKKLRSALGNTTSEKVQMYMEMIADIDDVVGAIQSLIRLQNVYNLSVWNMVRGDYLGHMGPELGEQDVVDIADIAFLDGHLDISLAWLQEALTSTIAHNISTNDDPRVSTPSKAHILATIGRIYIRQGRIKEAEEIYTQAKHLAPTDLRVLALEKEFITIPEFDAPDPVDEDYKRLCSLPTNQTRQQQRDPRLNCTYREVILPYYRFQEELISVSPYITVFYNVLTDSESAHLVMATSGTLQRAVIQIGDTFEADDYRTSELSLLFDWESNVVESVSKRIGALTNLDTWKHTSHLEAMSSERLQIINYGIGGHYYFHFDSLNQPTEENNYDLHNDLRIHGNRLSTFLLYLSDVTAGGATVFPEVEVSMKPVKNSAVFWYNFKPSGQEDDDTLHAGCPVVIGHKWIANKWIWSNANTFTRRCGLSEDASQLDIEPYMRKGWA